MSKRGFMLFREDSDPLRPHPDASPDLEPVTMDAAGFYLAYGCHDSARDALIEAQEDHLAREDAVSEGHLQDADGMSYPQPVEVHDDGSLRVFDHHDGSEICRYSVSDMYRGFFGMEPPQDDMPSL